MKYNLKTYTKQFYQFAYRMHSEHKIMFFLEEDQGSAWRVLTCSPAISKIRYDIMWLFEVWTLLEVEFYCSAKKAVGWAHSNQERVKKDAKSSAGTAEIAGDIIQGAYLETIAITMEQQNCEQSQNVSFWGVYQRKIMNTLEQVTMLYTPIK